MKFLRIVGYLALLVIVTVPSVASAQAFHEGVRPGGMGEAHTAIASGPSAIYNNPAGVARSVTYALEAVYEHQPNGSVLNAGIVDSKTNPSIAAGVGYSLLLGRDDIEGLTGHDIRLAIGIPVVPDRVSIGIGGRYLLMNQEIGGEDGETLEILNGLTLDAGAIFRISSNFHAGIAAKNLIPQCEQPICDAVAPRVIEGGLGFESKELSFGLDVGIDTDRGDPAVDVGVGAEYAIAGFVPIRLGFQRLGGPERNNLTAGLGYRSKTAGVDFGYQVNLSDTDYMLFMGSLSLYL